MRCVPVRFAPWLVASGALLLVAGCAPAAAPSPTSAPKPAPTAEAPKPAPTAASVAKAAAAAPTPQPAAPTAKPAAKPSAVSFQGKTMTLLVPWSAGGAADIRARQIVLSLQKHLPGNPIVVVRNMPGGGGLVGANWFYGAAPKDGTVIGELNSSITSQTIFAPEQAKFDLARLRWLAGVSETQVVYATSRLGIKSAEELPKITQKLLYGTTTVSSTRGMYPRLLFRLLGTDYKVIAGYGSSADMRAAIQRGELHLTEDGLSGYAQAVRPLVETGEVVPLLQEGFIQQDGTVVRDPRLPDVPTYWETLVKVKGEAVKQRPEFRAIELLLRIDYVRTGWAHVAEVPADTTAAAGTAFDRLLFADPEFGQAFEKIVGIKLVAQSAATVQKTVDSVSGLLSKDLEALQVLKALAVEAV